MKKIISLIASLAITAALIPSAFAHETQAFEITADVTKFTDETFYEYYEENIPEGYDAYMVVLGLDGLADTLSYTKTSGTTAKPKYSGTALDKAEIFFATDVANEKFYADYSYILDHAFSTAPSEGFRTDGTDGWTMNYNGNFIYPDAKDTEITEIPEYMTIAFVVEKGTSVTFTLDDATFALLDYADANITNQTNYASKSGQITMEPFTLGETKPADPVPGTVVTKDGYTTVIDNAGKPRFVVEDTKTSVGNTTAASVLKVTYDGTMKQANLWKLLGVETSEEPGEVTIGNLTVKVILKDTVTEKSDVKKLSIEVE